MIVIIPFAIAIVLGVAVVMIVITLKNKKRIITPSKITYPFEGAAYNNIVMYKSREEKALNLILNSFNKFTQESLSQNIDDLTNRIIHGQNNGCISQGAFQKTAMDGILSQIKTMRKVDVSIINYENGYMSVAVIFENSEKDLYQLLMKMNVQNGLLYLDSYNATLWFKKNI